MISKDIVAQLLPEGFPEQARVWLYQSSRPFSEKEQKEIQEQLYQFYSQWQSHGEPVKGWAGLVFNRYIIIMADETEVQVGGCSTDASMRMIKSLERQYDVHLFDRLSITFLVNNQVEMLPLQQVQYAIDRSYINAETLVFNNIVGTQKELLENWLIPLKDSWLAGRVQL
jgi:uncharacterized membrane protein YheB (UPF0754 family)